VAPAEFDPVAAFPVAPLGLPDWPTRKWVTGSGQDAAGNVCELVLAYGGFAVDEPLVFVTTSLLLDDPVDWTAARAWNEMRYRSGHDVEPLLHPDHRESPELIPIVVEGKRIPFRGYSSGDVWASAGRVRRGTDELAVVVSSRGIPPQAVELATVDDLADWPSL
jgi:hypothetical protein